MGDLNDAFIHCFSHCMRVAYLNPQIPKTCPGVPDEVLNPRNTWTDKAGFDNTLKRLGEMFQKNFTEYESKASAVIIGAGPQL